jgi:hypothetical protein
MRKVISNFIKNKHHELWDGRGTFKHKGREWFVYELFQNPVHMLWSCQMLTTNNKTRDIGRVLVEENDTPEEAIGACINEIIATHNTEWIPNDDDDSNDVEEYDRQFTFK